VGTSTVAYHLSTRLAASGLGRVLLLDGNGLDSGLTSALDLRAEALVQPTTVPRLFAMAHRADGLPPSDHLLEPGEPTTTLAEPRGATLVEGTRAANTRTFVIVDLAAVSESASTVERAKHADGTLFVVDPVRTDIHSARLALKNLCDGGANVMGTILNQQTVGGLA
jgi:Mrp family chromosome partitioning ATPase